MIFTPTSLAGAMLIDVEPTADSRGLFARTFCAREFVARGLEPAIAQASVSVNASRGSRAASTSRRAESSVQKPCSTRGSVRSQCS